MVAHGNGERSIRARTRSASIAACLLAASCSSRPPQTRDYLLPEPAHAEAAAPARLPGLKLKPLAVRSFLDRDEVAWREGDVLSGVYRYHRWAEPPVEMATRALLAELRARGGFAFLVAPSERGDAPFELGGELLGMHEQSGAKGEEPRGVVELELVLRRAGAGVDAAAADASSSAARIVRVRREVPASDASIDSLVRAVSEAFAQCISQAVAEVAQAIGSGR